MNQHLTQVAEQIAEAARWHLEEGTQEAREQLAGAVSAWEQARSLEPQEEPA